MKAIILAAGSGRRLGYQLPKAHVELGKGHRILDHQLANLSRLPSITEILIVIGFKKELFDAVAGDSIRFATNENFATTNTAKSLLIGLRSIRTRLRPGEEVLWLNGDVVFDPEILKLPAGQPGRNLVCVDRKKVGEEEVKYTLDPQGRITELSKPVAHPVGEAVGINQVAQADVDLLIECLDACGDQEYFERGIELALARGAAFYPCDIGDFFCVEVDFPEDLEKARAFLARRGGQ